MHETLIISIFGALAVWTGSVVGVVLWLTKQFSETRHTLRGAMDQRYSILEEKNEVGISDSKTQFGESISAVRQHSQDAHERIDKMIIKLQEVELYIRDNYIEVDSFNAAMARVEKAVGGLDSKFDKLADEMRKGD